VRALMKSGDDFVTRHDRSSLRILGSVGEPINPEAWRWYHNVVGEGRCPIVDTYWQTETGSFMITPLPGATPLKPGSATLPFFGVLVRVARFPNPDTLSAHTRTRRTHYLCSYKTDTFRSQPRSP